MSLHGQYKPEYYTLQCECSDSILNLSTNGHTIMCNERIHKLCYYSRHFYATCMFIGMLCNKLLFVVRPLCMVLSPLVKFHNSDLIYP